MSADHGHDHHHPAGPVSENEARARALESLLQDKGLLTPDAVDTLVNAYSKDIGPMNGAKVVARAWNDSEFKQRLLDDGPAAIAEMGFGGLQGEHLIVIENTDNVHNVVVCTLCSCYPWPLLGLPPAWYKSAPYRSRVVLEPRAVLEEFGTKLNDDVEVRVWDSSAEIRYMVLPQRPAGTERLNEDELAQHVGRDAMIGVRFAGKTTAEQP